MKRSIALLALGLVGCIFTARCLPPEPTPDTLNITATLETTISGEVNSEYNLILGYPMVRLANGLTDGNYFPLSSDLIHSTYRYAYHYQYIDWYESLAEISITGGNGTEDSCIFVTTTKVWTLGTNNWIADSFFLYKPTAPSYSNPIAYQYDGVTTVTNGDDITIHWEFTASELGGAASYFLTDTFNYMVIAGLANDIDAYVYEMYFIYNNADTNTRTLTDSVWIDSGDTSEVRSYFFGSDTLRTAANDTLLQMWLMNSDGQVVAKDTLGWYTTNKSVDMEWRTVLYRSVAP